MKSIAYESKKPDNHGLIPWDQDEDITWKTLTERQDEIISTRACEQFLEGQRRIGFTKNKVPQHVDVNKTLRSYTGWETEVVPALIPATEFFTLLANKKFPAASFIRRREQLDYLEEPDIFHEFYGHVPLLTYKPYADYMQEFGKIALTLEGKDRFRLFRVFWFSIEFGLLRQKGAVKAYGGGILSSIHETVYAIDSAVPKRVPFDALTALRTPYRIDIPQPLYYVLDRFEDLYKILDNNILELLEESKELGDLPALFEKKIK
jgi:phenylalanine-4-hydroxylase